MPPQAPDHDTVTGMLIALAFLITAVGGLVVAVGNILLARQKKFQKDVTKSVNGIVEQRVQAAEAKGHAEGVIKGREKSWREGGTVKKVLIIDDEKNIVALYQVLLESAGYLVFTATNGVEGFQKVQVTNPDAILLDWKMPSISGNEILQWIREITTAPIIVISGYLDSTDQIVGVSKVLRKPVEPNVLLGQVEILFKERTDS
jgi:CheY-like chemotaxis protein